MAQSAISPRPKRAPIVRIVAIAIIAIAVLFGQAIVRLITDWQWFGELGQKQVFTTALGAKLTLYFGFGLVFFLICHANFWFARHSSATATRPRLLDPEREQIMQIAGAAARWGSTLVAIVIAFSVGGSAATHWSDYLLYTHGGAFGQADPVFHRDIGFYVFQLPFLNYLQGLLLFTLFVATIGTAAIYYALRGADFLAGLVPALPAPARRHLLGLCTALAIAAAWRTMLSRYDLLYADNGPFFGAGYTDLHARLPAITIQAVAWLVVAALCIASMRREKPFVLPAVGLGGWVAVSILTGGVWPSMVQRFDVIPNQLDKEGPYISRDLEMTRRAYGLDDVRTEDVPAATALDGAQLERNKVTIANIRLWDWPQLGAVYDAKEALSTYYRFTLPASAARLPEDFNIDVDRYTLNGTPRQVMLGVRELVTDALPAQAKTWQNLRLVYTHGYGVVMSPVNAVDEEGLPQYFVSRVPIQSTVPEVRVDRPQIYFGERTLEPVFVNTGQDEFDHPDQTGDKKTRYTGTGGLPLGGYLNRLIWSLRLEDMNLLLSSDLKPESRILFQRGIRERVQKLAPMLNWDNDPYMVAQGGRLVWVLDGYTATSQYPYSQPVAVGTGAEGVEQQFNYIRNSVKAVVDAYDGTVRFYVFDEADPILKAYRRIFPNLFTPGASMPAGIRAHVRYPEDLFRIQRDIYATYHVKDPRIYYAKEDQWEVPADPTPAADGDTRRMVPYYVNMRLPGEKLEEFLLMTPFTPIARQNLSGWMCAKCDPVDYGKLVVYRFPKGSVVNGPSQVVSTIKRQGEISKVVTLLDQRGSKVIWGNLIAIPIERTLMYALPLYVQGEGVPIPAIYQVILASGNRVVMRPTLAEAIAALPLADAAPAAGSGPRGSSAPPAAGASTAAAPGAPGTAADILRRAGEALERARGRQREYDEALRDLSANLRQLEKAIPASR